MPEDPSCGGCRYYEPRRVDGDMQCLHLVEFDHRWTSGDGADYGCRCEHPARLREARRQYEHSTFDERCR